MQKHKTKEKFLIPFLRRARYPQQEYTCGKTTEKRESAQI